MIAIADAEKKLTNLRDEMRTLLNKVEEGFRSAKTYENNIILIEKYEKLIKDKEREIEILLSKKEGLENALNISQENKAMYIQIMEQMKLERTEMIEKFNDPHVFQGFVIDSLFNLFHSTYYKIPMYLHNCWHLVVCKDGCSEINSPLSL